MIDFLRLEDVLGLHQNQISLYGGDSGVRDVNLLVSALSQPELTYDNQYLHADIFEMAAAYLFHIVQNHPFLDGNKRTGAVAALVFLDINGIVFFAPQGSLYDIVIEVATGQISKETVAAYFRDHVQESF